LGLEHPGNYNEGDGTNISYDNSAEYAQDTIQYSIMSYFKESHYANGSNYVLDGLQLLPQTPMLHDVATIQAIYGAAFTTRTGDTVYGFNSSFGTAGPGSVFNFNANPNPILTIYDAGGNDTLDASGFTQNQFIDLQPGHYSSIGALKQNVAMAFNEVG